MSKPIDPTDAAIIAVLKANAREPVASLARKIGLSRTAVQERLARLERDGVIRGYTLDLGPGAETAAVRAYIMLTLRNATCARVVPPLRRVPGVVGVQSLTGDIDIILTAEGGSVDAISQVREEVVRIPGIGTATTYLFTNPAT